MSNIINKIKDSVNSLKIKNVNEECLFKNPNDYKDFYIKTPVKFNITLITEYNEYNNINIYGLKINNKIDITSIDSDNKDQYYLIYDLLDDFDFLDSEKEYILFSDYENIFLNLLFNKISEQLLLNVKPQKKIGE